MVCPKLSIRGGALAAGGALAFLISASSAVLAQSALLLSQRAIENPPCQQALEVAISPSGSTGAVIEGFGDDSEACSGAPVSPKILFVQMSTGAVLAEFPTLAGSPLTRGYLALTDLRALVVDDISSKIFNLAASPPTLLGEHPSGPSILPADLAISPNGSVGLALEGLEEGGVLGVGEAPSIKFFNMLTGELIRFDTFGGSPHAKRHIALTDQRALVVDEGSAWFFEIAGPPNLIKEHPLGPCMTPVDVASSPNGVIGALLEGLEEGDGPCLAPDQAPPKLKFFRMATGDLLGEFDSFAGSSRAAKRHLAMSDTRAIAADGFSTRIFDLTVSPPSLLSEHLIGHFPLLEGVDVAISPNGALGAAVEGLGDETGASPPEAAAPKIKFFNMSTGALLAEFDSSAGSGIVKRHLAMTDTRAVVVDRLSARIFDLTRSPPGLLAEHLVADAPCHEGVDVALSPDGARGAVVEGLGGEQSACSGGEAGPKIKFFDASTGSVTCQYETSAGSDLARRHLAVSRSGALAADRTFEQVFIFKEDCNRNCIDDAADIAARTSGDCNLNGVPDECDIQKGTSADTNRDGIPDECGITFRRGDANCDGFVDGNDVETILLHVNQGREPCCFDAADADDDGKVTIADTVSILESVRGGRPLPPPGPAQCGTDPTPDELDCKVYPNELCEIVPCCLPDGSCVLACRDCCLRKNGKLVTQCPCEVEPTFRRGDVDASGSLDINDPVNVLNYLFIGGAKPRCLDAADFDDNGETEITDAIANLSYQFLGGPPSRDPGPVQCGVDPTREIPELGCEVSC